MENAECRTIKSTTSAGARAAEVTPKAAAAAAALQRLRPVDDDDARSSMNPLVEWDSLELRLLGTRISEIAADVVRQKNLPVRDLQLRFLDGRIEIRAKAVVSIAIPFSVNVRAAGAEGRVVRMRLDLPSAYGFIPVPKAFFKLIEKLLSVPGFRFSSADMELTFLLDQFLPPFLEIEVTDIQLIEGGVAVLLGRGAADLPPQSGGSDGEQH
ncbi:MAG TPA: hypothetical protein VNM92_11245 [Thermoanaerobaculia bacterium]|nr:hypothetical protein [Thermoanaerobaculia bacterium]